MNSERNAYIVVEISACRMSAEPRGKNSVYEFLSRRLSVRPGKTEDRDAEPVAMVTGKRPKSP